MMNKTQTATGVASLARVSGSDGVGKSAVRPSFDEGHVAVITPATRGEPQATAAEGATGSGGREAGVYPVPGRSPEMNERIAGHEIGHCLVTRALGSTVHFVEIVPSGGFAGRCVRSGPPSSLNLLDETPVSTGEVVDVIDVCARLERLTPQIGSSRVADAEGLVRAQVAAIELVAGRVAEQILFPDLPPLNTEHDYVEARAFARVAVTAQAAAADLIRYAEAEAAALIRENLDVVLALIDAIMVRGFLTGGEVDMIIAQAVSTRAAKAERNRRRDWRERQASAAHFLAEVKGCAAR